MMKTKRSRHWFVRAASSFSVLCAIAAVPAVAQDEGGDGADVNVTEYGTVDLAVQDTDLAQVLQMLSIQSRKNIITSKNVSATVTANLFDVSFYEALDSILRVNGYGYMEEGNFIYVYTLEELEEIKASQRQRQSRIFEMSYLSASDADSFVQPLLSDDGASSFLGSVDAGFQPAIDDGGADSYAYTARIVVNDYPEVLEDIERLLADLDTPPQQVLVESTILQTALNEANAFGVDFNVIGSVNFTDVVNPLSTVTSLLAGSDTEDGGFQPADNEAFGVQSTVGNTPGAGGFKVGIVQDDISVFLRVLDEVTDSTVLARPKVMALNRQRAEVLVGRRVGYLSTTATETTSTQTIEYLDTGVHLVFRPFISSDGMIRMELAPSVSEAIFRDSTDSEGVIVTIPDEVTQELTTNVRVNDGETLVLGGLFRESNRITRRQVPWLGDIPLLGAAFRGQDDTVSREEIIFLITPTIMHDESLWDAGEEVYNYADDVRVGARAGLLPFSREKTVDNYNKDAIEAYSNGDEEKALYYINNSLRLHPQQPEIIRFREKITGEKEDAHERQMLERILNKEDAALHSRSLSRKSASAAPSAKSSFADRWMGKTPSSKSSANATTSDATSPVAQSKSSGLSGAWWLDMQDSDAASSSTSKVNPKSYSRGSVTPQSAIANGSNASTWSNKSSSFSKPSGNKVAEYGSQIESGSPKFASLSEAAEAGFASKNSSGASYASVQPLINSEAKWRNDLLIEEWLTEFFMALELPELTPRALALDAQVSDESAQQAIVTADDGTVSEK